MLDLNGVCFEAYMVVAHRAHAVPRPHASRLTPHDRMAGAAFLRKALTATGANENGLIMEAPHKHTVTLNNCPIKLEPESSLASICRTAGSLLYFQSRSHLHSIVSIAGLYYGCHDDC